MLCRLEVGDTAGWKPALKRKGPPSKSFSLVPPQPFPHSFFLMAERIISEVLTKPDPALEMTLRPSLFSEFTGQAKVKERLEITVAAAKQRGEAIDHILLSVPPGLGK